MWHHDVMIEFRPPLMTRPIWHNHRSCALRCGRPLSARGQTRAPRFQNASLTQCAETGNRRDVAAGAASIVQLRFWLAAATRIGKRAAVLLPLSGFSNLSQRRCVGVSLQQTLRTFRSGQATDPADLWPTLASCRRFFELTGRPSR
jgi:hypothetical protein